MIHSDSMGATLDAINKAFFYKRPPSKAQIQEAAKWIAARQIKSGPNAGLFAPTGRDYKEGVRLFTGEKLKTRLATRNVLGAEAARALLLFDVSFVQQTLERVNGHLFEQCFSRSCVIGECAHSSVGLVRYLAAGEFADSARRLEAHVELLSRHRDDKGRWKRFPFYYTLLALSEIDTLSAVDEMRYAAPACERVLRRSSKDDEFSQRRRTIVQSALARC